MFFAPEVLDIFRNYSWPGNIRELENAVEHAIIMSNTRVILPENLPLSIKVEDVEADGTIILGDDSFKPLREVLLEVEKRHISEAIERTGGNRTQAAKLLQISRRALLYKINENNID
jgi:two-component system response regulator AtoC